MGENISGTQILWEKISDTKIYYGVRILGTNIWEWINYIRHKDVMGVDISGTKIVWEWISQAQR